MIRWRSRMYALSSGEYDSLVRWILGAEWRLVSQTEPSSPWPRSVMCVMLCRWQYCVSRDVMIGGMVMAESSNVMSGYSPPISIELQVGADRFNVASLGPEWMILRDARAVNASSG